MKQLSIIILVLLLCTVTGWTQDITTNDENIEKIIREFRTTNNASALIVGVVEGQQITYYKYGTLSKKSKDPVSESTLFEIGSLSKLFTSAALVNMADNHDLFLEDRIDNYLPKYIIAPKFKNIICTTIEVQMPVNDSWTPAITSCRPDPLTPEYFVAVCDLASHASGLPNPTVSNKAFHPFFGSDVIKNPKRSFTKNDILEYIDNYLLDCPPGHEFTFSDLGYGVLGIIMGGISGMDYDHLIKEKLGKPLGLKNTTVWPDAEQQKYLADGYNYNGKGVKPMLQDAMAPAYGLRSTAEDLVLFLKANMGPAEDPLSVSLVETHHPRVIFEEDGKTTGIGLGWFLTEIQPTANIDLLWQNSQTAGYAAYIGFSKDNYKGVVVLANSSEDVTDLGLQVMQYLSSRKLAIKP